MCVSRPCALKPDFPVPIVLVGVSSYPQVLVHALTCMHHPSSQQPCGVGATVILASQLRKRRHKDVMGGRAGMHTQAVCAQKPQRGVGDAHTSCRLQSELLDTPAGLRGGKTVATVRRPGAKGWQLNGAWKDEWERFTVWEVDTRVCRGWPGDRGGDGHTHATVSLKYPPLRHLLQQDVFRTRISVLVEASVR